MPRPWDVLAIVIGLGCSALFQYEVTSAQSPHIGSLQASLPVVPDASLSRLFVSHIFRACDGSAIAGSWKEE